MSEKDALTQDEITKRLAPLPNWKQVDKALERVQTFPAYKNALDFVYQVGLAAEEANHHPDMAMNFKRVTVRYWTHTARGITALDFKMAERVEALVQRFYEPKKGAPAASK